MDLGVALDTFSAPFLFFSSDCWPSSFARIWKPHSRSPKFLSLYLMLAIGFRGGVVLGHSSPESSS